MLYRSSLAPFEEIPLTSVQRPITLQEYPPKAIKPSIDLTHLPPDTIIKQNDRYIFKKDSDGKLIVVAKKSGKIIAKIPQTIDPKILVRLGLMAPQRAKLYDGNMTLYRSKSYDIIQDSYGDIHIVDLRNKRHYSITPLSQKRVLAATVYKKRLYFYQSDLHVIDLPPKQNTFTQKILGIPAHFARIFPTNVGIILYLVSYQDSPTHYLLYYPFAKDAHRLQAPSLYRLTKRVYELHYRDGILFMKLDGRIYAIFPQGDRLGYRVE